jgi:hypothetical protein
MRLVDNVEELVSLSKLESGFIDSIFTKISNDLNILLIQGEISLKLSAGNRLTQNQSFAT